LGGRGAHVPEVVDEDDVLLIEDGQFRRLHIPGVVPGESDVVDFIYFLGLDERALPALPHVEELNRVPREQSQQVGVAKLSALDVVGIVPLELAVLLEAALLAQQPNLGVGLDGDEQGAGGVPGERSGALLVRGVGLVLEALEVVVVPDVHALLVLQPHHVIYKYKYG
jgi:hypothetical protein